MATVTQKSRNPDLQRAWENLYGKPKKSPAPEYAEASIPEGAGAKKPRLPAAKKAKRGGRK